jgi:hypothetical protein
VLHEDDYLNLIGLDFSQQSSHYEATKILRRYVHAGEYETWKLRTLLLTVINQEQDLRRSLCECYELYCSGYSFLDNLGLGCGLTVIVPPPQYGADNWYELSHEEKHQLLHALLPSAIAEAETVLAWLDEGKIVITDEPGELGHYLYLDRRADA